MKHPLPVALGLGVLAAAVAMILIPSPGEAEPTGTPAEGASAVPGEGGASTEMVPVRPEVPPWPAKAWDDFRYGLHLRYPREWEERDAADLPEGIPGSVILAVGPPGEAVSLAIYYVGVLVPRPGIEAMGRRAAEMAGTEITESGWTPYARRDAFRVRSRGAGRVEETTLFRHRRVLFAVRSLAPEGEDARLERLSEVAAALRLD